MLDETLPAPVDRGSIGPVAGSVLPIHVKYKGYPS